jgi:4-hydroxy-tetrahydrodipicolinate reductase
MTVSIAIAGAAGRMGRSLLKAAASDKRLQVTGGNERAESEAIGADLGVLAETNASGFLIADTVSQAAKGAQVWIDFTHPSAALDVLAVLSSTDVKAVILGTTGFTAEQEATIRAFSQRYAIVYSGNFSLGINVLAGLVKQAAARLGTDWDIEISEAHHRRKVDAPSGTALMLGKAAADGREIVLDQHTIQTRWGQTGARTEGDIGFAVVRAGGIVGEHEVLFGAENEIIRLSHSALDRAIFAKGALTAALWAAGQKPGLYSMADVLGFD